MSDIAFRSASALALAVRTQQVSSRELLEHYLSRVERYNPQLNAIVTLDPVRARQRADLADAATARGESWGPLHGVPMTVKDLFEVDGMRTTAGVMPTYQSTTDALAVQRLVHAGAVIFGKTNVSELGGDVQSYNPIFGTSNNPWNLAYSPGGSSGGAAAAVAAGLTGLELGSDLASSIRLPAHQCGVYGHKPSYGVVPMQGHIPGPPGTLTEPDLVVAGPLARSADDLALTLGILAGASPERGLAWKIQLPPARHTTLRPFRVVAWFDEADCTIDQEILARYQEVITSLGKAGVVVDQKARPAFHFPQAHQIFVDLLLSLKSTGIPPDAFRQLCQQADVCAPEDDSMAAVFARGSTLRFRDWALLNEARLKMRAAWGRFFQDYDVVLCPVAPTVAIPHDHSEPLPARVIQVNGVPRSYLDLMTWGGVISATHVPATVAPVGCTKAGLPVGIQIVGPYLEDYTPIVFAQLLADVVGGFQAPAGY